MHKGEHRVVEGTKRKDKKSFRSYFKSFSAEKHFCFFSKEPDSCNTTTPISSRIAYADQARLYQTDAFDVF